MRVLIVAPVEVGSGETITAMHMAKMLIDSGDEVHFLAADFAQKFIEKRFPGMVTNLDADFKKNIQIWRSTIKKHKPEIVIFADYPLMFFKSGSVTFVDEENQLDVLSEADAILATLDHTGFGQGGKGIFFGPPHISFNYEQWPDLPESMQVLLPCPMNEPGMVDGREGISFRYREAPIEISDKRRREIRARFLDRNDDCLIFHCVSNWAWRQANQIGLPFYRFYPEILDIHLGHQKRPVTIVSVNNGKLMTTPADSKNKYINLPVLSQEEFQELLLASDLMITENGISISLGLAITGRIPCVSFQNSHRYRVLRNDLDGGLRELVVNMEMMHPGAVYPWDIFPVGGREIMEILGLYHDNSILNGIRFLEIFDEHETPSELHSLIYDSSARLRLIDGQAAYIEKIRSLPDAEQAVRMLNSVGVS